MICLVGDILTDVTLDLYSRNDVKMRLGGIVHAARGLWAMGFDYAVAYCAPAYMDEQIVSYLHEIGCSRIHKIANITGSPYTILIKEAKEVGDQGYEFLYRDCINIEYLQNEIMHLSEYEDLMFISGNYNIDLLLHAVSDKQSVHLDVANNVKNIEQLPSSKHIETLFVSTSSELFRNIYTTTQDLFDRLSAYADRIVLKENRGGSRVYETKTKLIYQIPSQTSTIVHSVGVGDVYDVISIVAPYPQFDERLYLASWVSMYYAKTTFVDDFKHNVEMVQSIAMDDLKRIDGCVLPWENRVNGNIYIAAPDFDFLDTKLIDDICRCLKYHNFTPRRPIKEVGQMAVNAPKEERQRIHQGDMDIFENCNMLIAILLNNDPGTLIEIGLAGQRRMPTIVYDPYGLANNCMLTELPTIVSSNLDEVMSYVFMEYSKLYKNGVI